MRTYVMYILIYYANVQANTLNIRELNTVFKAKKIILEERYCNLCAQGKRIIVPRPRMIHNRLRLDEIIISVRGSFVSPCLSVSHLKPSVNFITPSRENQIKRSN